MLTWSIREPRGIASNGAASGMFYCEGECLSDDDKPVDGIYNGSKLMEMNTGKFYMFDAVSEAWLEWGA